MFLLDTNVVSELRKARTGKANARVVAWAKREDQEAMYLPAVTMLELELGAIQMERRDSRQGMLLRNWLRDQVEPAFVGRILPIDHEVAKRCALLHVPNPCSYRDSLIAATALVHALTIVTRNTRDFSLTGAALLNPWSS